MGVRLNSRLSCLYGLAIVCISAIAVGEARGDAKYDWSRLVGVRKIGYVNPFFTNVNTKVGKENEQDREYASHLRSLRLTLQNTFITRLKSETRFVLIPQAKVEKALHKLHWTAANLFQNGGIVHGKEWPSPNTEHIARLTRDLGIDGLVIGTLYEPASIGDGAQLHHEQWNINPLNISVRRMRAHVISLRVQSFLVTMDGATAWRDEQMADHPRTNPRTPRTLLLDWTEATAQVAEQMADSLVRLPPPGR